MPSVAIADASASTTFMVGIRGRLPRSLTARSRALIGRAWCLSIAQIRSAARACGGYGPAQAPYEIPRRAGARYVLSPWLGFSDEDNRATSGNDTSPSIARDRRYRA